MPGYRLNEYKIILTPHKDLEEKIMKLRNDFANVFKTEHSLSGRPHLTLAHFYQYDMRQERITNRLHQVAMGYPAFKVELKGFGSFPTHSIFINATSKIPLQGLVKEIRSEAQRLMKLDDEHKPHFILEPNFSIARKLLPWQYENGWQMYQHKNFTGRFIADAFLLLKRPAGSGPYQIVRRFALENMIVGATQGQLF